MRDTKIIVGILLLTLFFSCGKSNKEKAAERLNAAIKICEKGDTITALQQLDSVQILFPEIFGSVEKAKGLSNKINSEILYRKQDQFSKVNAGLIELDRQFDKEKTQFDRFTQYIHKMQKFERRWDQSFIQIHLDERGELYISSNYYGADWLNHTGLRVYDGIFQAKTDSVSLDDPNNRHSEFMNTHWEKVNYKNGKDNGVIQFIADNANRNLKAVFLGKRMYFIVLETHDKQAVKDALALSNALKLKVQLQKEINELQAKLN
jgi:hypothetical protein